MSKDNNYFQYFTFGLDGWIDKTILKKRKEMLRWFLEEMQMNSSDSILDIGVSDEDHPASNLLEKNYPYTENLTALGIDNLHHLEKIYSGLTAILILKSNK